MEVACLGLMVCDILVKPITKDMLDEDSSRVEFVKMSSGGDAFNVAVNLAKLGMKSGIIGKIGNDGFGNFLLQVAEESLIDTRGVKVAEECGTSTSVVMIRPNGERSFAFYGGATDQLGLKDINFDIIKDAPFLSIGSALALPALGGVNLKEVLLRAQGYGVKTVVDVTEAHDKSQLKLLAPALKYTNIFIPSLNEAAVLTGKNKPEEMAAEFIKLGVGMTVIKLGSVGCYIHSAEQSLYVPSFKVDAIDCTGAGDTFVAGFLTAYSKGWELYDCGRFANAAGALCVQAVGATTGIKSFEQVMDIVKIKY